MKPYAIIDAVTANSVNPAGPVLGILRAYLTDGKPPGGGPSWSTGMSLMDCIDTQAHLLIMSSDEAIPLTQMPCVEKQEPTESH
jgi:hypothetical protein